MPYCRNCGNEIPPEASYCPNCGAPAAPVASPKAPGPTARTRLADWGDRLVAILIDGIIVVAILVPIRFFLTWTIWPWEAAIPWFAGLFPFIGSFSGIVHFLYWTLLEGMYGQSIGKMIMRIKVTRTSGQPIDITYAAVESLGKAFLLPIDLIIGWILYPAKRQRLFNYVSDTIVVRI